MLGPVSRRASLPTLKNKFSGRGKIAPTILSKQPCPNAPTPKKLHMHIKAARITSCQPPSAYAVQLQPKPPTQQPPSQPSQQTGATRCRKAPPVAAAPSQQPSQPPSHQQFSYTRKTYDELRPLAKQPCPNTPTQKKLHMHIEAARPSSCQPPSAYAVQLQPKPPTQQSPQQPSQQTRATRCRKAPPVAAAPSQQPSQPPSHQQFLLHP